MDHNSGADLVVRNAQGLLAAIELKNREGLTRDLAAILRRNLATHAALPDVPFFLLISQDRGYLWVHPDPAPVKIAPDLEFPMKPVIKRYLPRLARQRLLRPDLEIIVSQWLWSLTDPDTPLDEQPERALAKVGFIDALKGGTVARAAAA